MSKEILDQEEKEKVVKKKNPLMTVINIMVALLVLFYLLRYLKDFIRHGQISDGLWSILILLPVSFLAMEAWRFWNKR